MKTETLKISSEHNISDWFADKDIKDTFYDKLISDALLNGIPIKAEHSYSLNKEGISCSVVPKILLNKSDDIENECYPAISLKSATCHFRQIDLQSGSKNSCPETAEKFCLESNLKSSKLLNVPQKNLTSMLNFQNNYSTNKESYSNTAAVKIDSLSVQNSQLLQYQSSNIAFNKNSAKLHLILRETSVSPNLSSNIEVDEIFIKEEPLSPSYSYPPSPVSNSCSYSCTKDTVSSVNCCQQVNKKSPVSSNFHKECELHTPVANNNLILTSDVKFNGSETITPKNLCKKLSSFGMPLTPPSLSPSDESQGNVSPEHISGLSGLTSKLITVNNNKTKQVTATPQTVKLRESSYSTACHTNRCTSSSRNFNGNNSRQPIHTTLISSQPKGYTGALTLTDEEKRTLLAEGYSIPQKLPLTKSEEKSLKKIRRKIKNKISAQESRRKKKEYMDQLERRVELLANENKNYKKRVESLEFSNSNLFSQLQKLQALVKKQKINT
ncbi:cyclic AMP response element-binding protein A [Teleopsis dalmanni]|uniref:cyclic AMP response element-binding protein A n=1 Tax=Teleopsis dalmanni TaxID=139649 RepID=UPI0018CE867D|nr:cyclic AMP response element-binding protein A [Teleopsis dalmanni]